MDARHGRLYFFAMFRRPVKEINAAFPAEFNQLDSIKQIVRENCYSADIPSKDVHALQLVVEEVASNIIRHAYKFQKGQIRLKLVLYKKLVVLSLIDTGRSFQPNFNGTINLERLVETGRKGGLGFYMVQKMMDSVEYISTGGYNEMRMMKRLKPAVGWLGRMMPLRVKFSAATLAILTVIIGVSFYFVNHYATQRLYANLDDKVSALATTIADQSSGYILNKRSDVEFDELIVSYLRANPELKLLVITDSNKLVMAHSEDIKNIRKPFHIPSQFASGDESSSREEIKHSPDLNFRQVDISTGSQKLGDVYLTYSTSQIANQLYDARITVIRFTLILFLFGLLGIYALSNYFVEPIQKITRRVRRFTSGETESELPLDGADEFFEISKAFNQMTTRLNEERKSVVEREKLAKELELASQIQKTLLPEGISSFPGLEIDAFYKAASRIGGDLYDAFDIGDGKYCIVVADVSGKGIPASLVMSMLRTVVRIYSDGATSARELLLKVNGYLQKNIPSGIFVTLFLMLYDSKSNKSTAVSAGHNPLILYRSAENKIERFNPSGMPVGLPQSSGSSYENGLEEAEITLNRGDTFMLYTDGVSEATDENGQHFGVERIEQTLFDISSRCADQKLNDAASKMKEALTDFSHRQDFSDDITFILGRRVEESETKDSKNELQSAVAENN